MSTIPKILRSTEIDSLISEMDRMEQVAKAHYFHGDRTSGNAAMRAQADLSDRLTSALVAQVPR